MRIDGWSSTCALSIYALDLRQAELVDLLGGHVGGGVPLELVGVVRGAVGVGLADAGRVHRGLGQFGLGEGDHAFVGGLDDVQQRLACVFLQFLDRNSVVSGKSV